MEPRRRLQDWHHILAMSLVMAVVSAGLAYLFLNINFIPHPASMERGILDRFMQLLFAIGSVFVAVIIIALSYSLLFFRRRKGDDSDARPIKGNTALEISWTIIPLLIVTGLGIYGAVILDTITAPNPVHTTMQSIYSLGAFVPRVVPPSGTAQEELVVNVTASRFLWEFEYPAYQIKSYVLEVPVNRRILFNIYSKDIIHSFWVQEWGPKQDAVPGLSPTLRITPTEIGQFLVQCSQLCGYAHTDMTAPVRVVSADEFDNWVQQQQTSTTGPAPPAGHPVMIDLVAQNFVFDKNTLTVPVGAEVIINFDNKDNGVPHNFAAYTDSSATISIYIGQIINGPQTITYTFTAPATPGKYFFRCDAHPTTMTGTLVVN